MRACVISRLLLETFLCHSGPFVEGFVVKMHVKIHTSCVGGGHDDGAVLVTTKDDVALDVLSSSKDGTSEPRKKVNRVLYF